MSARSPFKPQVEKSTRRRFPVMNPLLPFSRRPPRSGDSDGIWSRRTRRSSVPRRDSRVGQSASVHHADTLGVSPGSKTETPIPTRILQVAGSDILGSELDENARLWKVFRTDVTYYDLNVTVYEWNETLGNLLVFAALFLSVVTAFIIQTYPALLADPSRATSTSQVLPSTDSQRLSSVMLALWFLSLIISLIVAFFCIVAKQWLQDYALQLAAETPNALLWARHRARYKNALDSLGIDTLVRHVLPLLLHIALFLFAVGLNILVAVLQSAIAWFICAITVLGGVVYVTSAIARVLSPALRPQAALVTPHDWYRRVYALFTGPRVHGEEPSWDKGEFAQSVIVWLLTVSHSDDALSAAFCAVGALPKDSHALHSIRQTGFGIADAYYSMRISALMPIDVMRVIRSELHLRPGDWTLDNLGLVVPKEFTTCLKQTTAAYASVLVAALLDPISRIRSFAINSAEWRNLDSLSLTTTIRLLLECRNIDAHAVLYLLLPLKPLEICAMRQDFYAALRGRSVNQEQYSSCTSGECTPACAIALLVQITTSTACSRQDFVVASQLAARVIAFLTLTYKRMKPHSLVADVPWDPNLVMIQQNAELVLRHLHARDPLLGWCRTQGRILHLLISAWCKLPRSVERVSLGHRAGFVLESLLNMLGQSDITIEVKTTITSMLVVAFLDTATPLEAAIQNDGLTMKETGAAGSFISPSSPAASLAGMGTETASETIPAVSSPANETHIVQTIIPSDVSATAWENVHLLQLRHSILLQLAVALASGLCSAKRSLDKRRSRQAMFIPVFLRADALRQVLADSTRVERVGVLAEWIQATRVSDLKDSSVERGVPGDSPRGETGITPADSTQDRRVGLPNKYVHLAQHCIELDWLWCPRVTNDAAGGTWASWKRTGNIDFPALVVAALGTRKYRRDGESFPPGFLLALPWRVRESVCYYLAERLESIVVKRGPCTHCEGPAPDWPPNYPRDAEHEPAPPVASAS